MKNYKLIKTDHDSDCAVYNEPAYPNGLCSCGLFPDINKGIHDFIKITGPHIHEGERDGLANAFQCGFNFKQIGGDIEFLLDEFKSIEKDHFDKLGKKYPNTPVGAETAELMRHLIFKMEECLSQTDNRDLGF